MKKFSLGLIAGLIAVTPTIHSQEVGKPLGDAAREQLELHKSSAGEKTYRNEDVEPAGSSVRWKSRESRPAEPSAPPSQSSTYRPETPSPFADKPEPRRRSVFDHRTEEEDADAVGSLLVPEGTELKVEVPAPEFAAEAYTARTVAPVRVSFVTAIPALSTARLQTVARRLPWYSDDDLVGFFEALVVTQVVVEGVVYRIETDRVARSWEVRTPSELTFKLLKPLTIQR